MRMTEFWTLVDEEFGPGQGRALVRDHVLSALAQRTAEQAIAAGEDPRQVWFALCDDLQVPPLRRWGRDQAQPTPERSGRRRGAPNGGQNGGSAGGPARAVRSRPAAGPR